MKKALFALFALVFTAGSALAQPSAPFREGTHYFVIEGADAAQPGDEVTVTEAFSYLCNHCATFEPYINNWKSELPEGVTFDRIPVEFGRAIWGLYARAYVTASVLGVEEEAHSPMMNAIWKERKQMRNMEELAEFYSQFGVDKDKFVATSKSFAVDMRMKREQQQIRAAGVSGTPSMIVNDRYRVSAGGAVTGFDAMLDIVDYLVGQELAVAAASQEAEDLASADAPTE